MLQENLSEYSLKAYESRVGDTENIDLHEMYTVLDDILETEKDAIDEVDSKIGDPFYSYRDKENDLNSLEEYYDSIWEDFNLVEKLIKQGAENEC